MRYVDLAVRRRSLALAVSTPQRYSWILTLQSKLQNQLRGWQRRAGSQSTTYLRASFS